MKISGTIALVTGASSGIGRDVAIDLARRGATVAVTARRVERLESTLAECRRYAPGGIAIPCDLRDGKAAAAMVGDVERQLGRVDILVNNAGVGLYRLFTETSAEEFLEVFAANTLSAFHCTRAALPGMLARERGSIVFVSSFAGRVATFRHTAYSASKFALTGLAEALYYEVRSKGVHVGVVNPGAIRTELFEKGADYETLRHVIEPRLVGTEVVTRAVAKLIERERFEIFAPWSLGLVWKLRAILPGPVMRGTVAYVEKHMRRPG